MSYRAPTRAFSPLTSGTLVCRQGRGGRGRRVAACLRDHTALQLPPKPPHTPLPAHPRGRDVTCLPHSGARGCCCHECGRGARGGTPGCRLTPLVSHPIPPLPFPPRPISAASTLPPLRAAPPTPLAFFPLHRGYHTAGTTCERALPTAKRLEISRSHATTMHKHPPPHTGLLSSRIS